MLIILKIKILIDHTAHDMYKIIEKVCDERNLLKSDLAHNNIGIVSCRINKEGIARTGTNQPL